MKKKEGRVDDKAEQKTGPYFVGSMLASVQYDWRPGELFRRSLYPDSGGTGIEYDSDFSI